MMLPRLAFGFALAGAMGCHRSDPTPDAGVDHVTVDSSLGPRNKVDVLFMLDNSNPLPEEESLKRNFDRLISVLGDLSTIGIEVDLHIGVVTSDYGAGATGAPGCQPSPGGQLGKLQTGGGPGANCQGPTTAGNKNFIEYDFAHPAMANLPPGQDLVQTFSCMANVGVQGCGFEHPLESVHAALHNGLPENAGFLRDDALLAVFFLTDEDDASASPTTDIFDRNKVAAYGYEDSYSRQTRFAIVCGPGEGMSPPYNDSGGPLSNCRGAPNPNASETYAGDGPGKQYPVDRYIDFFTRPAAQGGVKVNPRDVILFAIDAPSEPFQVILSNPGTPGGMSYEQCHEVNENANPPCVPVLQHSCQNPQQPVYFGDPAVRLNQVVNAAATHGIHSICDLDYGGALERFGRLLAANVVGGCIPEALADPAKPDCSVGWQTNLIDGKPAPIPNCAAGSMTFELDPSDRYDVCWKIEPKAACQAISPDGVGITIVTTDPDTGMTKTPPASAQMTAACVSK